MEFSLPDVSGLPGITARPATLADAADLLALERSIELEVNGETSWTLDEVSEPFTTDTGRASTAVVAVHRGDALIAQLSAMHDNAERYYASASADHSLDAAVYDPVVAAGISWAEQTVRAHAAGAPARLKFWAWEGDSRLEDQLRAAGYEAARAFIEMHLDLEARHSSPAASDVTVRQADVGDGDTDDARLVHHLVTETFRDHYDFIERPFDRWIARHKDNPNADFSSWWIAEVDGQPAGVRIDDRGYRDSHNAGYIANLGTLRAARGKGVAKALLAHAFERAAADGQSAVKLHVDAESPTGATALYEAVGMRRNHVGQEWQKTLPASSASARTE